MHFHKTRNSAWLFAAMLIAAILSLAGSAFAGGGAVSYADAPNGGLDKRQYYNYRIEGGAATGGTGNFLTKTFTAAATDGAALANDSNTTYTVIGGAVARTMELNFAEADSDNPTIVFKIVGQTQWMGGTTSAIAHVTCVGDATVYTDVAFLPYPTPIVYVESGGASIENTDTLNINLWGLGIDGDPQSAAQVGGLAINGARIDPSSSFTTRFSTKFASWKPALYSDLPDNASFEIRTATTSLRSSKSMEQFVSE